MVEPAARPSALVGVASAAVALGVTQLVAVPFGPGADSRTAVGSAVIDLTPGPVKEWAIQLFGTADKLALTIVVLGVVAVIAALTGQRETGRIPLGSIAIVLAGVAGCAAVLNRAGGSWVNIVPTLVGTACGIAVLRLLVSGRFTDAAPVGPRRRGRKFEDGPRSGARRGGHRPQRRARRRTSALTDHDRLPDRRGRDWSGGHGVEPAALLGGRRPRRLRGAVGRHHCSTDPPGGAAGRGDAAAVRHTERRLLPHRHRPVGATGQPG